MKNRQTNQFSVLTKESLWKLIFNRKSIFLFLFLSTILLSVNAQVVNTCMDTIYDSGGAIGNYSNNESIVETYCSDSGNEIKLNFTEFDLETNFDYLFIYDGPDINSTVIGVFTNSNSPGTVVSTSGCLTLQFESDASTTGTGYTAVVSCVNACDVSITSVNFNSATCTNNNGSIDISASGAQGTLQYSIDDGLTFQPSGNFTNLEPGNYQVAVSYDDGTCIVFGDQIVINSGCIEICNNGIDDDGDGDIDNSDIDCANTIYTCSGNFYDLGGPSGNYPFDTSYVNTFCSDNGAEIQAQFIEFNLSQQPPADSLIVYDGPDTLSPVIGRYFGQDGFLNEEFRAKSFFLSTNGCLTFQFKSGLFGTASGWNASISCTSLPSFGNEICGNGLDDDGDGLVDFQDPDCPEALDVTTCQQGFSYYIPPVWKMGGEDTLYSSPAILYLSTSFPNANVNIQTADGSFNETIDLSSGVGESFIFDESTDILRTDNFNTIEQNKGLIVTSDFPIQLLYALDGRLNKNLMTIKGKESFGKSFRVGSQTNTLVQSAAGILRNEHHFISVMATEDNTEVVFTSNTPLTGITTPHTINLDAGDSYLLINEDFNVSVTGALVTSDKEIVVVSGSQHTSASGVTEDDGGVDMLVPTRSIGTEYVLMRGDVFDSQDYGIIVAVENNTKVFSNNVEVATLNAGEYVQVDVTGPLGSGTYINATERVYCYHISGLSLGEVGMAIAAPLGDCRGDDFATFSRFSPGSQFALNVVIKDTGLASLTLNGLDISSYSSTIIQPVAALPGYSTVTVRDADIAADNIVASDEFFNASIIIGDPVNAGTFGYITSFNENVNILDPNVLQPTEFYVIDTICRNDAISHSLTTFSCGNTDKIRNIAQGSLGTAVVTGDLSFEYTSNGITGDDVISVTVVNEFGIQSTVCLAISIDSNYVEFNPDQMSICAGDTLSITPDSIGGPGPYTYEWSTNEITSSISVVPTSSTVYSVIVTDANGCTGSDQFSVTVQPNIIADAGDDIIICETDVAILSANQPLGTTGTWTGGQGTFENPNNANTTYTPDPSESNTTIQLYWTLDGSSGSQCFAGTDSLSLSISPALVVSAGEDDYVCIDSEFFLSELNAEIFSTSINTGIWTSNGDGVFMPGATSTGQFPSAVSYVPGPTDNANGQFTLTLEASDPNTNNGCGAGSDDVTIFIQDSPVLACNDDLNISVNKECFVELNVDMLIENPGEPEEFYEITLKDEFGNIIPGTILNSAYINRTIEYSVTYECGGNNCWGNLTIEDKQIPDLIPGADTLDCRDSYAPEVLGFPVPPTSNVFYNNNGYFVGNFDGCGNVELEFEDEIIENGCGAEFETTVFRNWTATDESGNMTTATDTIFINRISLDSISLPLNYDDIDKPTLSCSGNYPLTDEGYPSPEFTGYPDVGACDKFQATYTDLRFDMCGNTYKVVREWLIFDWCTSQSIKYFQTIKITDKQAPEISCPQSISVSTDDYSCNSGLVLLTPPVVSDNCSEVNVEAEITGPSGEDIEVLINNGNLVAADLPLGISTVTYTAYDECENSKSCSYIITVRDLVPPTPVCEGHTKLSLNNVGTARLYATSLDDGSHDNCEIDYLRIAKMSDACGFGSNIFGEYVDFCCNEIGQPIMVALEVTDIYGNANICMAEVTLEDKIAPIVTAPTDLTISCTTGFDEDDLTPFGKIVNSQILREDIIINDEENNGVVGIDGLALDNCNFNVDEIVNVNIDCGVGVITRTFIVTDDNNQSTSDVQTITVINSSPFDFNDINFPNTVNINGCAAIDTDPNITGRPTFFNEDCASIVTSYEDKTFTVADSACLLVLRTWKVLDMCQYNPNTGVGIWTNVQSIKVNNFVEPQFTSSCADTTVCSYGDCGGDVYLEIDAEDDCTAKSELVYSYSIDLNDDGIIEFDGFGSVINRYLDDGTYRIRWSVEDKCGNIQTCNYLLTVEDCKEPTPYCLGGVATALMNNVGMVEVTAASMNLGSFDNCSEDDDLIYSFSSDINDFTRVYTCDSLLNGVVGVFDLEVWVTDEAGNQDFCSVQLSVQDNFDVCPNTGTATISGNIVDKNEEFIENTKVVLSSDFNAGNQIISIEDNSGYSFTNLPQGISYNVSAQNDENVLNGVTTLDIVLIQKHILGIAPLNEATQIIAADVNHSESVSGADMVQIRKAILGFNDGFPDNTSWRFVDKSYDFSNADYFDFPEYLNISQLSEDKSNADLLGIKIGDINGSASANLLSNPSTRSINSTEIDVLLNQNKIEFKTAQALVISGMQFELLWDEAILSQLIPNTLDLQSKHMKMANQSIRVSFDSRESINVDKNEVLFSLEFDSKEEAQDALNSLTLVPVNIIAELYDDQLEIYNLELNVRESDDNVNWILYQNTPNPFNGITSIGFELPSNDKTELLILDASGKIVYRNVSQAQKGYNQIDIQKAQLSNAGVYYYQLNTSFGSLTKKMILID